MNATFLKILHFIIRSCYHPMNYLHQSYKEEKTIGVTSKLFEQEARHEGHDAVLGRVYLVVAELGWLRPVDEDDSDVRVPSPHHSAVSGVHLPHQVAAVLWIIYNTSYTY
jgi:hypothetical protein